MRRSLVAAALAAFLGALLVLSSVRAQFTPGPAAWAPVAAPCASTSKWNPADVGTGITLSNTNCTATAPAAASYMAVRSTPTSYVTTGGTFKVYLELEYLASSASGFWTGGIGVTGDPLAGGAPGAAVMHGMGLQLNPNSGSPTATFYTGLGSITLNATACATTPGVGQWVGFAFVIASSTIDGWCTINGSTWNTGGSDNPATPFGGLNNSSFSFSPLVVAWGGGQNAAVVINTSAPFHFTVPSGFSAFASLQDKRQFAGDIPR